MANRGDSEVMYLFVFIFLLLSILGLYVELYALQAARFLANQKSGAQIMLQWHDGAYMMAKEMAASLGAVFPCSLTAAGIGAAAPCGVTLQNPDLAIVAPYTRRYLPLGYNFNQVRWPSVVYQVGTARYMVTYVVDAAAMPATTTTLGYTPSELLLQLRNANTPAISYGQVQNVTCNAAVGPWLVTNEFAGQDATRTQICYPTSFGGVNYVPIGAVGIVSVL